MKQYIFPRHNFRVPSTDNNKMMKKNEESDIFKENPMILTVIAVFQVTY